MGGHLFYIGKTNVVAIVFEQRLGMFMCMFNNEKLASLEITEVALSGGNLHISNSATSSKFRFPPDFPFRFGVFL